MIYYSLVNLINRDEYQLTAKTDLGARRQAKAIIKSEPESKWQLDFHRTSDGCRGAMDI